MGTAAILHVHGVTIETSLQTAEAPRPIAGSFASAVFAAGIVGTGILGVPVLAGSAAMVWASALRWPIGLNRLPSQAKSFYTTISVPCCWASHSFSRRLTRSKHFSGAP